MTKFMATSGTTKAINAAYDAGIPIENLLNLILRDYFLGKPKQFDNVEFYEQGEAGQQ